MKHHDLILERYHAHSSPFEFLDLQEKLGFHVANGIAYMPKSSSANVFPACSHAYQQQCRHVETLLLGLLGKWFLRVESPHVSM